MKYTIKIADQFYEVEIEDIHARPIIALVDGERFEVHPENGNTPEVTKEARNTAPIESPTPLVSEAASTGDLTAPLPGTIIEVFIKAGEQVEVGKVVLVIEAMKMKNSIRSTRTGKVAEVLVSAGQSVAHKQALVRFE
jgi:glutaconyl-CoA/methylmalonyl-CoA decarboxylase subunit gamma